MSKERVRELKNIPISISILHEQEYNNLHSIVTKRRALSEKYKNKTYTLFTNIRSYKSIFAKLENH